MKRSVIIVAVGAILLAGGAVGGWLLYQRHVKDQLTLACFNRTNPDACFNLAVIAFKSGQISEMDRLVRQHCYQRNGIESGLCVVEVNRQVEASALK